jgi:hypothetical protein
VSSEPEPTTPSDATHLQAALNAIASLPDMTTMIACSHCRRTRTLADDYDYTPLQLFTGRPLGWFNSENEQMCGDCLTKSMRGEID